MKILNTEQLRAADRNTIVNEPIKSIDLMERAALNCVQWFHYNKLDRKKQIHIFCGMGNNGGDGLAIARLLHQDGFLVYTYLVHFSKNMSDDFITNFKRIELENVSPQSIYTQEDFPVLSKDDIVIDAIFGIGFSKPITGFTKKLIQYINQSNATVFAIDVPSGLPIDSPVQDPEAVIKSNLTLTFQAPKLAFLLPENQDFVADFAIIDIGLDKAFINQLKTNIHYTIPDEVVTKIKKRKKFSHKGSYGHSLLIGGSFGKIGAVVLASKAALQIGSGLVTAFIPKCGYQIVQTAVPEVMVEVDAEDKLEFFNYKSKPSVIGIGIGMGTDPKTATAFGHFLKENNLPMLIDADGLNIISQNKELLNELPPKCILTPHPKELERLLGSWGNDYDKINKIKAFSKQHNVIVVLKGAHTLVVDEDNLFFNSSGKASLATAGSGDVLTGIITGLLAQRYSPLNAAILGVFLHGSVANLTLRYAKDMPIIASDIVKLLPEAFDELVYTKTNQEETDKAIQTFDDYLDDLFFDDDFDAPF